MVCRKCGKEFDDKARFCDGCGATIKQSTKNKTKNKRFTSVATVIGTVLIIFVLAFLKIGSQVGFHKVIDIFNSIIEKYQDVEESKEQSINIVDGLLNIEIIKKSSFKQYPNTTIEEMFSKIFTDIEYSSFTDDYDISIVVIKGHHGKYNYIVHFMLINSEELKNKYGDKFVKSYSDDFYISYTKVGPNNFSDDEFLSICLPFYESLKTKK